jgi:hypothetical protein
MIRNHFTPNRAEAPPTFFAPFFTGGFLLAAVFPNRSPSDSESLVDSWPVLSEEREAAKLVFAPCSDASV